MVTFIMISDNYILTPVVLNPDHGAMVLMDLMADVFNIDNKDFITYFINIITSIIILSSFYQQLIFSVSKASKPMIVNLSDSLHK